jgi:acetyl-CoA C-acetyltransferase
MRPVYAVSGGVSKFAKARPDKTFQAVIKEAYDYAVTDLEIDFPTFTRVVDGSVASYFSDHFARQLMAGIMAQDYLGLCPKPSHRVEGGGATGGICLQEAWKSVASGHMDVCVAYGFETMSHVETWKGNEFIALASDIMGLPGGRFYSGYCAMIVTRHMKEFDDRRAVGGGVGQEPPPTPSIIRTEAQPLHDRRRARRTDGRLAAHRLDICVMSDSAANIPRPEEGLKRLEQAGQGGAPAGTRQRHRPRHGRHAHVRPPARRLRDVPARLRHRTGIFFQRDEGLL